MPLKNTCYPKVRWPSRTLRKIVNKRWPLHSIEDTIINYVHSFCITKGLHHCQIGEEVRHSQEGATLKIAEKGFQHFRCRGMVVVQSCVQLSTCSCHSCNLASIYDTTQQLSPPEKSDLQLSCLFLKIYTNTFKQ